MPLSVHELKSWVGTPTIFVLDCSAAGVLVPHFVQSTQQDDGDRADPGTPPIDGGGGAAAGGAGLVPQSMAAAAAAAAVGASGAGGHGQGDGNGKT